MIISSKDIVFNLLKCIVTFYAVYFAVGSLAYASFSQSNFDGKIPFDFESWIDLSECCSVYKDKELVNVISMEVTYFICGVVFGVLVRSRVWDYAITVSVIHILLSCLVMLAFPMNWSWWVCLGCGLAVLILVGEAVGFARRKKSLTKVNPEPSQTNISYLYRKG
ncbi:unnamed protein product [Mytilus edulis]|uniref:Transmembrane protein 244 n=1 Tax=Mytilus edulis TaxID=6550 RepID=A0A8S3RKH1_MYTED|nr:unnamed protein product [Mytilus edulis]